MSINSVVISGRLVRDPETRATSGGGTSANFSVAVQRSFVDKQTGQREADFIDCVAFGKTADFVARYFAKGSAVEVCGELRTRSYTDKNGNKRNAVEVWVDKVGFGESKRKAEQEPPEYAPAPAPKRDVVAAPEADFAVIEDSEDLPW